jgi:hypothetical protein
MAAEKTDETAFADAARNVCGRIERECGITVPPDTLLERFIRRDELEQTKADYEHARQTYKTLMSESEIE